MNNFRINFFLIILYVLFFVPVNSFAQIETEDLRPGEIKRAGKRAEHKGDIYSAIDYYSDYVKLKPEKAKYLYKLAELYFKARNYSRAEKYYKKAFREERWKYPQAQFKYAVCLKMQGKYKLALRELNVFKRYDSEVDDSDYTYYRDRLESEIKGCKMALKDTINKNYVISNPGSPVNHKHIDFNPIPRGKNKLVFSSLQLDEMKYFNAETDTLPKRKIYTAIKEGNNWKIKGEFAGGLVNSETKNTGNGAFSRDGKRFYFTRCQKESGKMICRIYKTELKNNEWTKPVKLNEEINAKGYTATMPAVGVSRMNTDMLYFVSDREGGEGNMDIWYTYWDPRREKYRRVRNCGRDINTEADELSPYYHIVSKTLYFSSNGKPNYGGLDVFNATGSGRQFNEAVNMGKPINSAMDDLYFSKSKEGYFGYLVSNRDGGKSLRHENCCDDIYYYIDKDYISVWLKGKIYGITDRSFYNSVKEKYENSLTLSGIENSNKDTSAMKLLHKYPVSLFIKDPETGEQAFVKTDSTHQGKYNFMLEQGYDYVIKVKDFNRKQKEFYVSTKNITKDDTIVKDAIIVNTIPTKSLVLKNVYYEYKEHELNEEARNTISETIYTILKKYPNIVVEISSHSDSVGSDSYNLKLSRKRAQSVVDYLVELGIPEKQLRAKGYGEEKPIAPNTNPDGTPNEEGMSKNRRTEFKIIGELEEYSKVIYEE